MGGCFSGCVKKIERRMDQWGLDPDEVFAYSVPKVVKIRDAKLGVISLCIQLAIFLYILVDAIILSKGYLKLEQIGSGSVVTTITAPVDTTYPGYQSDLTHITSNTDFCDGYIANPMSDPAGPADKSKLPCIWWGTYMSPYPAAQDYSVNLATKVKITALADGVTTDGTNTFTENGISYSCNIGNAWAKECLYNTSAETRYYYVPMIEDYIIDISHGVEGVSIKQSGSSYDSAGKLVDSDGDEIRSFSSGSNDEIYIHELLSAAGVSLDATNGDGVPNRYDGMVLLCYIEYTTKDSDTVEYTYKVELVDGVKFQAKQVIYSDEISSQDDKVNGYGRKRRTFDRSGIKIVFAPTGELGEFNFNALLTTIVSGLALFIVAKIAMTLLLTQIFADREIYKNQMYSYTEDMEVYRGMDHGIRRDIRKMSKKANKKGAGPYWTYKEQEEKESLIPEVSKCDNRDNKEEDSLGMHTEGVDVPVYDKVNLDAAQEDLEHGIRSSNV